MHLLNYVLFNNTHATLKICQIKLSRRSLFIVKCECSYLDARFAMACCCLGVAAGCSGRKNYSSVVWIWKREQMTRMSAAGLKGASSRSSFAIRCSSISEGSDRDSKKLRADDMLTLSTKISTDVPLYEPHGVGIWSFVCVCWEIWLCR